MEFLASLPFILSLGFVVIMLLIAYIIETRKKHHNSLTAMSVMSLSSEGSGTALKAHLAAISSNSKYKFYTVERTILSDKFIELLKNHFKERFSFIKQECTLPDEKSKRPTCSNIISIETSKGPILVSYGEYSTFQGNPPRYKWIIPSDEYLDSYEDSNSQIKVSGYMQFAMEPGVEDHPAFREILDIIELVELEYIIYPSKNEESSVRYFSLEKEEKEYNLVRSSRKLTPMSKVLLKKSYNQGKLQYGGQEYSIEMDNWVEAATASLQARESISIFGESGAGKTYLADEIARRMSRKDMGIIYITPAMVSQFQDVEMYGYLQNEIVRIKSMNDLDGVIFVIDEAERLLTKESDGVHSVMNSFMLSMLEGIVQKTLDCACILTFNCDISQLNEKAFRTGRMGLILNLGKLPVEQANELVIELQQLNPNLVFDQERWASITKTNQKVVLAEVYGCFSPPSKSIVIQKILGKYVEPKAPAVAKAVKAPIPAPAVPAERNNPVRPPKAEPATDVELTVSMAGSSHSHGNNRKNKHRRHR